MPGSQRRRSANRLTDKNKRGKHRFLHEIVMPAILGQRNESIKEGEIYGAYATNDAIFHEKELKY